MLKHLTDIQKVFVYTGRYVTGSVWPSVIAHSAHNRIWLYGELFTQNPQPIVTYITGDVGVVLFNYF